MNRLTDKLENNSYDFACSYNTFMYNGGQEEIINKLGKLEDIEEELGIDLLTLFKALKQDYIYFKHHYGWSNEFIIKKEYIQGLKYQIDDNTFVFWTDDCGKEHLVYIKDFHKKWALTREELENE